MSMRPPVAKIVPHEITTHGHRRVDPYFWLKNKGQTDVTAYLEAENAYAEAVMASSEALRRRLYREMVGRIRETDQTVPVRIDDFFYYSRTEEGRQYPIFCRRAGSPEAAEQILLDLNEEAEGFAYLSLGLFKVSPDHKTLAYSVDTTGAEDYVLRFKNLISGEKLGDEIANVSRSLQWANDGRTVFYTVEDRAKRPFKALCHRLGQEGEDRCVFIEPDGLFQVAIGKTKDQAFLTLRIASIETAEVRVLPADLSATEFRLIEPRQAGLRYRVEHRDGLFYILTNDDAPNCKLVTAPVTAPDKANWRPLIEHDPGIMLNGLDMFERHLAIYERRGGLRSVRVMDLDTGQHHEIEFHEPVFTVVGGDNPMYRSQVLRFTYSSLTTPNSVFDYDMVSRQRRLLKQQPVLGDFDPANYASERLFITAEDGAKIPVSLVYRKDLEKNRRNPCLLYGYGAYGISVDPTFSSHRLSLLDRGVIFAIAHVRGGQEMGRQWYDQGKFLAKRNTFTDFIASMRALIEQGYTSRDHLAIMGGSAGGLLVGAVLNMAPELIRAAVAKVPFVDLVTTMLDDTLPLTVREYEEWGDPNEPRYYHHMLSYSPYDNVEARAYPHLLVTAGLNDPRVHYWEPAKWVAKLRALKTDDNRLLLKTNMGAGHGGPSGRYEALRDLAFDYAFILETLQVEPSHAEPGQSISGSG